MIVRQSRVNLFLIAALIVVVDQATKAWVLANLASSADQQNPWTWFNGLVSLIYTPNPGAAFGLLADQTALFVLVAIVVAAATVAYYRYLPRHSLWLRVSLGLQLGGALGNLIDRLHHGFVVDFLEVWTWPVFNVADSAIVIGVLMLAYYLLLRYDTTRPPTATPIGQSQQIEENDTSHSLLNH